MHISLSLRLSVTLCALLSAVPPLPQAYGQPMSPNAANATLPDAQINLGIPSGSVDARKYGAVCDGVTNVVAAVNAAVAAGALKVFLPANCLYKPTANQTPTGVEITGEDWKTSTISVANRATDQLSMGARAVFRNVAIISLFCDNDVNPLATQKVCPVGYAANISDSAATVHNWVYQSVWVRSGPQVTGPTGVVSTDIPNVGLSSTAPGADVIYLQSGGAATSAARIVTNASNAYGIYLLNGFGDAGNDHTGLFLKEFSNNGGTASKSSLYIDRASATGGVPVSLTIADGDSGGDNTSAMISLQPSHQTSGNLLNVFHTTSAFTGDIVRSNMASGSGSFTGNFFNHTVNNVSKIKGDSNGNMIAAGNYVQGDTQSRAILGTAANLQLNKFVSGFNAGLSQWSADNIGATKFALKSRATSPGGHATVVAGDQLYSSFFYADDGTNYLNVGKEVWDLQGTVGTGDISSRWFIQTAKSGTLAVPLAINGNTQTITIGGGYVPIITDPVMSSNYKVNSSTLSKTSDTGFATVPGLTVSLAAGKTYSCYGRLTVTASDALGGIKVTLANADTLSATSISMTASNFNGATTNARSTATALGSAIGAATAVVTDVQVDAAIVVNAAGTIALRAAQNASSATATTVGINSSFHCNRVS
jgi:hypothetical protein